MAGYAVMPQTDYENACAAVREKTNTTGTIKSGDLAAKIRSIAGGAGFTSDNIHIRTYEQQGGTVSVVGSYATLRVPLPVEAANAKFMAVCVAGYIYGSEDQPVGTFGSSGVMDNQEGTNADRLFIGVKNYTYTMSDKNRSSYKDDDEFAFYNSELNCFEFEIGAMGDKSAIIDIQGDLQYWYF